ncbi:MAG: FtsW/RodA/SpoVE family cell cycle protein, partial [Moorella sp. (in: Bacteria)]|nr:FtsW/RodA/SpoVE family cell cycle protein [Moorella sp. (in: firmicutes)]
MSGAVRRLERKMLFLAGAYLATGLLILGLLTNFDKLLLALFFVFGLFLLVSYCWEKGNYWGEPYLLPLVAVLSWTSLIFLYRLNPAYCWRQFIWLLAGIAALLATTHFFRNFHRLAQ